MKHLNLVIISPDIVARPIEKQSVSQNVGSFPVQEDNKTMENRTLKISQSNTSTLSEEEYKLREYTRHRNLERKCAKFKHLGVIKDPYERIIQLLLIMYPQLEILPREILLSDIDQFIQSHKNQSQ